MELSLTPPSALSPPSQHSQSLTTSITSMAADQHHPQMPVVPQLQETSQLLLTDEQSGGQAQMNELHNNTSVCHDVIDPSTSSNLVDHQMITTSDHSQTHLSQHVREIFVLFKCISWLK